MTLLPQLEDLLLAAAAVLTALAGLVAAVVTAASKLRRELAQISRRVDDELSPNSGTSTRDAINRTELAATDALRAADANGGALAELRNELLGEVRGMRRDIGRLADADQSMAEAKQHEHARIHRRIDQLETQLRKET
ncbi:hypothetical protein HJ590_12135 [Naumannella sp. ID2617S]|nr:hypothetical protein [Naumannella sp. ID2617S]